MRSEPMASGDRKGGRAESTRLAERSLERRASRSAPRPIGAETLDDLVDPRAGFRVQVLELHAHAGGSVAAGLPDPRDPAAHLEELLDPRQAEVQLDLLLGSQGCLALDEQAPSLMLRVNSVWHSGYHTCGQNVQSTRMLLYTLRK